MMQMQSLLMTSRSSSCSGRKKNFVFVGGKRCQRNHHHHHRTRVINEDASSSSSSSSSSSQQQQQQQQQQTQRSSSSSSASYGKYSSATDSPLDLIDVPLELVQIRAYVRWEEAGKPEGMPAEWQAAEFARALDDLRVELVEGTPLNEIRRKFNVMTVNNGEDDAPMKLPREVEEYKREREEMMRRAAAMGVSQQ